MPHNRLAHDDHRWMSVANTARALGIGRTRIMNLCSRHTLRSAVIAGRLVIERASVQLLKQQAEDAGHVTDTDYFDD